MGTSDEAGRGSEGTLGRIALKKMSVVRSPSESSSVEGVPPALAGAGPHGASEGSAEVSSQGSMNNLVPYLDLFSRLGDEELARLAQVSTASVAQLRRQVDEICRALLPYADLLPRLRDDELVRLTGAPEKTIRFWRLCQPRNVGAAERSAPGGVSADSNTQLIMPDRSSYVRSPQSAQGAGSYGGGSPGSLAGVSSGGAAAAASAPVFPGNEEPRPSRSKAAVPADDDDELTITQDDFF